jgi:hypothetical protein
MNHPTVGGLLSFRQWSSLRARVTTHKRTLCVLLEWIAT